MSLEMEPGPRPRLWPPPPRLCLLPRSRRLSIMKVILAAVRKAVRSQACVPESSVVLGLRPRLCPGLSIPSPVVGFSLVLQPHNLPFSLLSLQLSPVPSPPSYHLSSPAVLSALDSLVLTDVLGPALLPLTTLRELSCLLCSRVCHVGRPRSVQTALTRDRAPLHLFLYQLLIAVP